ARSCSAAASAVERSFGASGSITGTTGAGGLAGTTAVDSGVDGVVSGFESEVMFPPGFGGSGEPRRARAKLLHLVLHTLGVTDRQFQRVEHGANAIIRGLGPQAGKLHPRAVERGAALVRLEEKLVDALALLCHDGEQFVV